MDHFYNLDLRIHKLVLQYAIGFRADDVTGWIPKLKYLHVCSQWTEIAEPLVLQDVYIHIHPDKNRSPNTPQKCTTFTSFTNAHIFVDRGYHSLATNLFISMSTFIDYPDFFNSVFSELNLVSEWPSVCGLDIDMAASYDSYLDVSDDSLLVPSENMCSAYVDMLYAILPNVNRLRLVEPNLFKSAISNLLTNKYMRQLHYLVTLGPVTFTQNRFSEHLTCLQIALNHKNKIYLPYLCAAPLIRLALSRVPPQFSWDEFYDAKRQDITFDNLKELLLSFIPKPKKKAGAISTQTPERLKYYRLHFPKLKSLIIECCPADSEILNCHPYFENLDSLMINGPLESTTLAMDMGLRSIANLKVLIEYYPSSNIDDFYKTSNYLFSKLNISDKAFFWVEAEFEPSNMHLLCWPNLTHLLVGSPILVDNFLNLISMLPNLVEAIGGLVNTKDGAFEYLELQNDFIETCSQTKDSMMYANNNRTYTNASLNTQPVLASNIRCITLLFDDDDVIPEKIKTSIIGHIASVYYSLDEICVDQDLKSGLPKSLAEMQISHPHTANIKYHYVTADQVIVNFKRRTMFDEEKNEY